MPQRLWSYPLQVLLYYHEYVLFTVGYKREDVTFFWTTGNNNSVTYGTIEMSQFKLKNVNVRAYNHSRMNDSGGKIIASYIFIKMIR